MLGIISQSCKQSLNNKVSHTSVNIDSIKFKTYADTIVCDMVVKNPDKDDAWMEQCLSRFQRKAFLDSIFSDIYAGNLIALDYLSHKPLSISEVKKMEEMPGFSRNIIGKFQFREAWYYDNIKHAMIKKVYSITFGYENYDDTGFVKGYKPLFRVDF